MRERERESCHATADCMQINIKTVDNRNVIKKSAATTETATKGKTETD